jgi:DNA-binding CsgD family transcriptional regulator
MDNRQEQWAARRAEARRLRDEGLSLSQIGRRLGVSQSGAVYLLRPPSPPRPSGKTRAERQEEAEKRRERAEALFRKGVPPKEIARNFGISPSRIYKLLEKGGGVNKRKKQMIALKLREHHRRLGRIAVGDGQHHTVCVDLERLAIVVADEKDVVWMMPRYLDYYPQYARAVRVILEKRLG